MGLGRDDVDLVHTAALLHDIGKFAFPDSILLAEPRLKGPQWEIVKRHPEDGARIVRRVDGYGAVADVILSHHERWDGGGYPRGLSGDAIPSGARVIAVADAWDAMTSNRAYRQAVELEHALEEMEGGRGGQFEPRAVDAFLALLRERPELLRLHTEYTQEVDAGAVTREAATGRAASAAGGSTPSPTA